MSSTAGFPKNVARRRRERKRSEERLPLRRNLSRTSGLRSSVGTILIISERQDLRPCVATLTHGRGSYKKKKKAATSRKRKAPRQKKSTNCFSPGCLPRIELTMWVSALGLNILTLNTLTLNGEQQ